SIADSSGRVKEMAGGQISQNISVPAPSRRQILLARVLRGLEIARLKNEKSCYSGKNFVYCIDFRHT
ncbi:hypothetical protein, partial [Rectinema subterraneum]|uniref:hypothetical protein n=1 Tax=Rectinema subterraneum TaxID=2653714 RepID=UPI001C930609